MRNIRSSPKEYFPLFLYMKNKQVLVVGGGKVGKRRATLLQQAGAKVTVIEPNIVHIPGVRVLRKKLNIHKLPSFKKYFLVVAATDDPSLNSAISEKAKREGCLVNRADSYENGDVIFPAVAKTKNFTIAISSGGRNPRMSKRAKEVLERAFRELE
jgi:siroheme synthase-like protein